MTDSLSGKQLDQYKLDVLLGRGGMARVYRGYDKQLKRYAAIKIIDTPFQKSSEYLERFQREAQAIAALEHPNIIVIYHVGQVDDLIYMAMRFVEGADLYHVLYKYRQNGELIAPQDALRIIREIGSALDYAHASGVIHRDIKPSNILIDKAGRAILSDFGLALLTEMGTKGEIFGSPHYMSPEQAVSSAKAVPQSDLYSVGVILYEMLTGKLPFEADEPVEVALKQLRDSVPSPRTIQPTISQALERVTLKALAKDPKLRYQTGKELADALETALKEAPPQHRPRLSIPQIVEAKQKPATQVLAAPPPAAPKPRSKWAYFWGGALVTLVVLVREALLFFV